MILTTFTLGLLLHTAAPASTPAVQSETVPLRFQAQAGQAVRKDLKLIQRLRVQGMFSRVGDERRPGNLDMSIETERRLLAVDHYRAFKDDGTPSDLRRTFETLEREVKVRMDANVSAPRVQPSSLAGTSVVYEWSPETKAYGMHFDAKEGAETELAGLHEDIDFRGLLPKAGEAKVGDSWEIPATDLGDILAPGGEINMLNVGSIDAQTQRSLRGGMGGSLFRVFEKSSGRGGLKVTLLGLEQDGRLARLGLEADLRVASDQTDYVRDNAGPGERRAGVEYLGADLSFEFKGSGNCMWDVQAGRADSLILKGPQSTSFRIVNTAKTPEGESIETEQYIQMQGNFELKLDAEAVEPPAVPGPGQETQQGPQK